MLTGSCATWRLLTACASCSRQRSRLQLRASAGVGGAPIFSLFREALPAARLERFRGILNSTTNLILTELEHGNSIGAAVRKALDRTQLGCGGIAETDPSFDVDGWDATVKVCALASAFINRLSSVAPLRQAW
jgi:homoserine dehydrogenase